MGRPGWFSRCQSCMRPCGKCESPWGLSLTHPFPCWRGSPGSALSPDILVPSFAPFCSVFPCCLDVSHHGFSDDQRAEPMFTSTFVFSPWEWHTWTTSSLPSYPCPQISSLKLSFFKTMICLIIKTQRLKRTREKLMYYFSQFCGLSIDDSSVLCLKSFMWLHSSGNCTGAGGYKTESHSQKTLSMWPLIIQWYSLSFFTEWFLASQSNIPR